MYTYKAFCYNVVDGDTVDLNIDLGFNTFLKGRVRLGGIDTPETRTTELMHKEAGLKVKQYVTDLILNKEVYLVSTEYGKYGRILGEIYLDKELKESLNDILINLHMAKQYDNSHWTNEMIQIILEN